MPRSRPLLALTVGGWLLAVTAAAYLFGRPLTGFALAAFLALTWMLFAMYPSPAVKTSPAAPAPVRPIADVRRVRRLAAQFRALRDAVGQARTL